MIQKGCGIAIANIAPPAQFRRDSPDRVLGSGRCTGQKELAPINFYPTGARKIYEKSERTVNENFA
jgi:hypothetical protein